MKNSQDVQELQGELSFYTYVIRDMDKGEHRRLSLATMQCKFGEVHTLTEMFKTINADVLVARNVHAMFTFRQYVE